MTNLMAKPYCEEQAKFEKWFKTYTKNKNNVRLSKQENGKTYVDRFTAGMWHAWVARSKIEEANDQS